MSDDALATLRAAETTESRLPARDIWVLEFDQKQTDTLGQSPAGLFFFFLDLLQDRVREKWRSAGLGSALRPSWKVPIDLHSAMRSPPRPPLPVPSGSASLCCPLSSLPAI